MSPERIEELDAAVGVMVADMRHILGHVRSAFSVLAVMGVLAVLRAAADAQWVHAASYLLATAILLTGWADTDRRRRKYHPPSRRAT